MERKSMICFECLTSFVSIDILIQHIKHMHPFAQNFVCKQNNCQRIFPCLHRLKKHLTDNHIEYEVVLHSDVQGQIKRSNNLNFLQYENVTQDDSIDECSTSTKYLSDKPFSSSELFYNAILHFISKMYSDSSLPRNIVPQIVNNAKELFDIIFVYIESVLKRENVTEDALNTVRVIYNEVTSIFEKFATEHKIFKVIKNSKCYVESSSFFIGERSVIDRKKKSDEVRMIVQKSEGQIIELHNILKQFLELPNVFEDIICYMQEEEFVYEKNICRSVLQADL